MLHHPCHYNSTCLYKQCPQQNHATSQRKIMHHSRVKGRMPQAKRSTVQYILPINLTTTQIELYPPLDASITTVILISFLGIRGL